MISHTHHIPFNQANAAVRQNTAWRHVWARMENGGFAVAVRRYRSPLPLSPPEVGDLTVAQR
jgi:hypothetical protein